MRYLLLLIFLLPCLSQAECINYIAASEVTLVKSNTPNAGAKACVHQEGHVDQCLCFDNKDLRYHEVQVSQVDDLTKPIPVPPYNTENCDSNEDCMAKMPAKLATCTNGHYAEYSKNAVLPGFTLYCTGVSGYEQKQVTDLVINSALKTSVEASDAQKVADAQAILAVAKDAMFGNKMIAFVSARIRTKSLSLVDTKLVLSEYKDIIDLLRSGSITHAKTEIEAVVPDGARISQTDKDALLAEINSYLGL